MRTIKILSLILVIFFVAISFTTTAPQNFTSGGIITISEGESLKEVASDLAQHGYIRSSFVFTNLVILSGKQNYLSPGDYYFEKPISVFGVAYQIAKGEHHLDPIKITIPEGKNISETAQIFKSKLSEFDTKIFESQGNQYEGYLFPETYFEYPRANALSILSEMRTMFKTEAEPIIKKENTSNRNERDIVIMASLIEKEAKGADDRAIIAGILWNRIERQIPLQVDATVAYAKNIPENALQKGDTSFDSPYNTYIYRGLPPGPISNPGILALQAAIHPANTAYLYYIHDKYGNIHYAKTYVEHQQNINKYLR
ncbi:MAG: endolytic transglycosylase MltG [bacterium]